MAPVSIRKYQPSDRAAIREICREASRSQPDPLLLEDPELALLLFVDYYLEHEPDSCFVAEADNRVVGYRAGCCDTARYEEHVRRRVTPRIILRIARKIVTLRYRRKETYRALWWSLFTKLATRPKPLSESWDEYPAHSHCNVEPDYRGGGIGFSLSVAFHDHLRVRGITGVHSILVEREGAESYSRFLRAKRGYRVAAERDHLVLQKITGQKYVLRLLVCDLEQEARTAGSSEPAVEKMPKNT
jgi:GNAT superfamily N-acetyltransferase